MFSSRLLRRRLITASDSRPPILYSTMTGMGKNAVDLACNASQLATGVITLVQFDGDEHVGLQERGADGVILEQCCAASKLFICELKSSSALCHCPTSGGMVEFAFEVELFSEFLHRARFHSAVGGVAESFK